MITGTSRAAKTPSPERHGRPRSRTIRLGRTGYVKKNAIAGRAFSSWTALEAHLAAWTREIADRRVHGTTGEVPIERFQRAEASALGPVAGIPPFAAARELVRKVQADCAAKSPR